MRSKTNTVSRQRAERLSSRSVNQTQQESKNPGNTPFPGSFHARESLMAFDGESWILPGI
jgi:hypothetical protein